MCKRRLRIVAAAFTTLLLGSLIPVLAQAMPPGTGLGPVVGASGSTYQLVHYRRHHHYPRYRFVYLPYWGVHHHHWIDHGHFGGFQAASGTAASGMAAEATTNDPPCGAPMIRARL